MPFYLYLLGSQKSARSVSDLRVIAVLLLKCACIPVLLLKGAYLPLCIYIPVLLLKCTPIAVLLLKCTYIPVAFTVYVYPCVAFKAFKVHMCILVLILKCTHSSKKNSGKICLTNDKPCSTYQQQRHCKRIIPGCNSKHRLTTPSLPSGGRQLPESEAWSVTLMKAMLR